MQQRYYDPIAGRFLSMDPISTNADTGAKFDRYMYANNNPYRFTDPDGRDEKDDLPPQAEDCGCRRVTLPPVTISGTKAVEAATPGMLATMLRVSRLTNTLVLQAVKPDREQRPDDVPTGTKPVDKDKRLDREKIHGIKGQIGAQPRDWVGIDADGNIWTNEGGSGANQGHYTDFVN
jgi:uncharacterized protein RhaS with RHS repeats